MLRLGVNRERIAFAQISVFVKKLDVSRECRSDKMSRDGGRAGTETYRCAKGNDLFPSARSITLSQDDSRYSG